MSWEQQEYQQQGYPQQPYPQPSYPQQQGYDYAYGGYQQPQYVQPPQYAQEPYPQQQYVDYGPQTAPLPVVDPEPEPEVAVVGERPAEPAAEEKPPSKPAGRDRYFDTLRAVALIRVVTYHTFGWAWCGM
ncbi:MAG: acyltransferase, partial [Streptomyces sp.]|nr:acyltransferase [Streptomyces sp.]NUR68180.1 acyltransferase [Streptomyces sp.]